MTAESGQLLSVQRGCYLPGNYQPGTALLLHSYRGWIWCKSSTQAWLLWTVEKCKHFRASSLFLLIKGKKQFPTVSEEGTILRFLFCLYLRFWGVVFLWFVFVFFFCFGLFFWGFFVCLVGVFLVHCLEAEDTCRMSKWLQDGWPGNWGGKDPAWEDTCSSIVSTPTASEDAASRLFRHLLMAKGILFKDWN